MASLKTKYEFDRWAASVTAVAMATINEALCGPEFRATAVYAEHRTQIGRELLTRHPALLGQLAGLADTDAALAVQTATAALQELRASDPLLFQHSYAPKKQVVQWVLRAWPNRDLEQVRAEVDYAMDQIAWNMRYASQKLLLEVGADLEAIRAQIERAS